MPTFHVLSAELFVVIVVGGLAAAMLAVVVACRVMNLILRRPILNGWLWGGVVVMFLIAYHLVVAYWTADAVATEPSDPNWSVDLPIYIGVFSLLGVAAWRALAWQRKAQLR